MGSSRWLPVTYFPSSFTLTLLATISMFSFPKTPNTFFFIFILNWRPWLIFHWKCYRKAFRKNFRLPPPNLYQHLYSYKLLALLLLMHIPITLFLKISSNPLLSLESSLSFLLVPISFTILKSAWSCFLFSSPVMPFQLSFHPYHPTKTAHQGHQ